MIVDSGIQELINLRPGDEIVVAKQEEYYNGAPRDAHGNSLLYKEVKDIVKNNGKLVILI